LYPAAPPPPPPFSFPAPELHVFLTPPPPDTEVIRPPVLAPVVPPLQLSLFRFSFWTVFLLASLLRCFCVFFLTVAWLPPTCCSSLSAYPVLLGFCSERSFPRSTRTTPDSPPLSDFLFPRFSRPRNGFFCLLEYHLGFVPTFLFPQLSFPALPFFRCGRWFRFPFLSSNLF